MDRAAVSLARTALSDPASLPVGEGPDYRARSMQSTEDLREYAVAQLDVALATGDLTISFSDEAGETFQTFVAWLGEGHYTVEVRTIDGDELTASVVGVDHASQWNDAVLLQEWEEGADEGTGSPVSYRVQELHVV